MHEGGYIWDEDLKDARQVAGKVWPKEGAGQHLKRRYRMCMIRCIAWTPGVRVRRAHQVGSLIRFYKQHS